MWPLLAAHGANLSFSSALLQPRQQGKRDGSCMRIFRVGHPEIRHTRSATTEGDCVPARAAHTAAVHAGKIAFRPCPRERDRTLECSLRRLARGRMQLPAPFFKLPLQFDAVRLATEVAQFT